MAENSGIIDVSQSTAANCTTRGVSAEAGYAVCDMTNCSGSAVGFYVSNGGVVSRAAGSGTNSQTRNVATSNGMIYSNG